MPNTMTYTDTINRVGYTVINGVKVVQHTCVISADDPQNMRVLTTKLDKELYKANREICRADIAEFEDACYKLQESYLSSKPETVEEE